MNTAGAVRLCTIVGIFAGLWPESATRQSRTVAPEFPGARQPRSSRLARRGGQKSKSAWRGGAQAAASPAAPLARHLLVTLIRPAAPDGPEGRCGHSRHGRAYAPDDGDSGRRGRSRRVECGRAGNYCDHRPQSRYAGKERGPDCQGQRRPASVAAADVRCARHLLAEMADRAFGLRGRQRPLCGPQWVSATGQPGCESHAPMLRTTRTVLYCPGRDK